MNEIEKIINSLGDAVPENKYVLKVIDGEWWIEHDIVGSGEPVEQWLKHILWNTHIGSKLEFISRIERNGDVSKNGIDASYLQREYFKLTPLSLSHGTYIAHGFNSFVVKKKK